MRRRPKETGNQSDEDDAAVIARSLADPERFALVFRPARRGHPPLSDPVGTVRSRLNRARTALRAALGGTNPLHITEEVTPWMS
ncbi:MAG TPA: hypothetical protein VGP57_08200 [Actinoplanes sp.]|nr:hypothetical protein [Actinoplanes sp.]